jgi:prevent-host-death family protein
MEAEAGIRELKARLSAYLRRVKAGETLVITERGKPIGRIVPISQTMQDQLELLVQAGLVAWNGQKLSRIAPVAQAKEDSSVAELLLENRE